MKFSIGSNVKIIELGLLGCIKSILINTYGTQYEVRYFWNSEARSVYFYEDELLDII